MPNQTPNYNLTKPLGAENYDIEVQNGNMDKIDNALKGLQDSKAPLASPTFTGTPKIGANNIATTNQIPAAVTIANNLTETAPGKALDATQGKELKELISTKLTKFVGTTTGTGSALTATISGATLSDFVNVQVKLHADIADNATFNLNSLGAKPILLNTGEPITAGAVAGAFINLIYSTASSGAWYLLDNVVPESIPDGATVTPVDDYQIWLRCAGINPLGYANLAAVISDTTLAMPTLCNNLNALRYMVRSTAIILPAVLNNANWVTALDSCAYAVQIPTMTSATTPSGVATGSHNYDIYHPFKAFNKAYGVAQDMWILPNAVHNGWIQYQFSVPVRVYRGSMIGGVSADRMWKTVQLQSSDDGVTFTNMTGAINVTKDTSIMTNFIVTSNSIANSWRLNCLTDYNNTYGTSLGELYLYGLDLS